MKTLSKTEQVLVNLANIHYKGPNNSDMPLQAQLAALVDMIGDVPYGQGAHYGRSKVASVFKVRTDQAYLNVMILKAFPSLSYIRITVNGRTYRRSLKDIADIRHAAKDLVTLTGLESKV